MKMVEQKNTKTSHRGGPTALATKQPDEDGDLLVWMRLKRKGLYELYRRKSGDFFVRRSGKNETKTWPIGRRKARSIISNAERKRRERLTNKLLRNGYAEEIDGTVYNSKIDEILYVGVGDKTEAAAIYRTRDGHAYMHIVEYQQHMIWPLYNDDELNKMIPLLNFWFNYDAAFRWFLDVILFDGPIAI
jgi:hypothetical protein